MLHIWNISNDLENIQETDTPPQSPKNLNDTIKVNFGSGGGSVQFKKGDKVSPIREQVIEEAMETPKRPVTRTKKPRRLIEYNGTYHHILMLHIWNISSYINVTHLEHIKMKREIKKNIVLLKVHVYFNFIS
jgi:hypothetical protein